MKRFINGACLLVVLFTTSSLFAQTGSNTSNYIPELVFQNPVLVSGVAGQNGAVYKFSNIASGIDARVTIKTRSAANVILSNIDVPNQGWGKAFQPQLGIPGTAPANTSWWMEFEMRFYRAGTTDRKRIKGFKVTAIDVDGDGGTLRETIQMNKVKRVEYSPINHLVEGASPVFNISSGDDDDDDNSYNNVGVNKLIQGPIANFTNIDTSGTAVMTTFSYEEKDMIVFRYGATTGTNTTTAGERMNSLWFKAFDLAPRITLPVRLNSFSAIFDKKNVNLAWTTSLEENFNHFVVERSTDGINFKEAGVVLGLGITNGTETAYKFRDAGPASSTGMLYYRLRMVDLTGEATLSDVKVIRLGGQAEHTLQLAVFPNPVTDALRVTLPQSWQGKAVVLEVYSNSGQRVMGLQVSHAGQTENLRMAALPRGFYVVKAQCEGAMAEQKLIKN